MHSKFALLGQTAIISSMLFCFSNILLSSIAHAQNVPTNTDAGRVQRDIEKELKPPAEISRLPDMTGQPVTVTAPEGAEDIKLVVKGIVIDGAKKFGDEKFLPLYSDMLFKEVPLTEIYTLTNNITKYYRDRGYLLSRAFVPEQQIKDGVVHIQVIEGFISSYRIQNPGGIKDQIERYAKQLLDSGALTSANLERYLLLMNDLPGVAVRSVLVPSNEVPDSAELVLEVTETKFQGYASGDNFGNTYLGPNRVTLSGQANSLFNSTDQINLIALNAPVDNELSYYNAGFHHNIGSNGTKLGFNLSYANTKPTLPLSSGGLLEPEGQATTFSLDINHPFIRSRRLSVYGGLVFDVTKNKTDYAPGFSSIETKDQQRIIRANTQITYTDKTGAYNGFNAILSHGLKQFGASEKGGNNLSRAFGDPNFTKVNFEASRLQHLYGPFSGQVGVTGQYSLNDLLSSEQFGFGGNEFGRGYDSSEVTGEHGLGGKVELAYNRFVQHKLLKRYQAYTFYDIGKVWSKTKMIGQPGHESLASIGIGTRFFFTDNLRGDTYIAKPLTHEVTSRGENSNDLRFRFSITTNF